MRWKNSNKDSLVFIKKMQMFRNSTVCYISIESSWNMWANHFCHHLILMMSVTGIINYHSIWNTFSLEVVLNYFVQWQNTILKDGASNWIFEITQERISIYIVYGLWIVAHIFQIFPNHNFSISFLFFSIMLMLLMLLFLFLLFCFVGTWKNKEENKSMGNLTP